MAITYKQSLVQLLNKFCFQNIWNETSAEYCVNIALAPVTGRYLRGRVQAGIETIELPTTTTQYLCFTASLQMFFGGLSIDAGIWVTGEDILNSTSTLAHVYTTKGKLIPRKYINVYRSPHGDRIFIAISKAVIIKIFGITSDTVYLTMYHDADQVNDIACKSWYADPFNLNGSTAGLLTWFTTCKNTNAAGTQVLINGVEVDESGTTIAYVGGDYIEIICDENVIGAFDVNLSNNTTAYYSDLTSKYREIIHCPKSINPTNRLITHNTCTLTIRDSSNVGRYFHRVDAVGVGQITHNDLSVETDVVDAFRDYMVDQNVHMHVRVRLHGSDNILMTELFYMTFLYRCSDEDIVKHMRAEIVNTLPFWKASELEQSTYTQMMFDTPNSIAESVLDTYINGLGYHTVSAILASHVFHGALAGNVRGIVTTKPAALYNRDARPLVYVRGKKLNRNQYTYTDGDSEMSINIDAGVYLTGNDPVSIALIEDGAAQPYVFYPIIGATTITVPFADAVVYEEIALATPLSTMSSTANVAYGVVPFTSGSLIKTQNVDGTTTITAGATHYDKTLIVANKHFSLNSVIDITNAVGVDKGSITIPLTIGCANEAKTLPALGFSIAEIYVNGWRLVEDLDVTVRPLTDVDGNIAAVEAVLSCAEYLDVAGGSNWAEYVLHTGLEITSEAGYVYEGKVSYDTNINIWHDPLGSCFIRGKLSQNPIHHGNYLEPMEDTLTGDPYSISVTLPGSIGEVLAGYDRVTDLNRLTAIQNYFLQSLVINKDFILLEDIYHVFSPYLAQIVRDLVVGDLTAIDDPDNALFIAQFSGYDYLKQRDPTIVNPTGVLDRVYVDVLTTYVSTWTVPTPELLIIINRLVKLTLPNDPNAMGDTY